MGDYKMDKEIIYRDDSTEIRRLNDSIHDYKKLEQWYNNPEVNEYFEQRILTYEEIKKKYYPRTKEDCNVKVFIINQADKAIGLVQYYKSESEKLNKLGIYGNTYEIDIFIGEKSSCNKGIGTKIIRIVTDYLFESCDAKQIILTPQARNMRAIKCYINAGYKIEKEFTSVDTLGNTVKETLLIIQKENYSERELLE